MLDSVPLLADASFGFQALGIASCIIGIVVGALPYLWHDAERAHRSRRFVKIVTGVIAAAGIATFIVTSLHIADLKHATQDRQIATITEAWGLAPEDAEVLLDRRGGLYMEPVFVKLDGETQPTRLYEQGDRLLLLGDDDRPIPIER